MHLPILGLCALLTAQSRDPFAGEYQGQEVRLTLEPSAGGQYKGSLLFEGQGLGLTARASGGKLSGTFQFQGEQFPFDLRREGDALVLFTAGAEYRLQPVGPARPANPLASKSAPSAGGGIVGTWRNPQGSARFDANGTGVMNGEAFRYQAEGREILIQGERAAVRLAYAIEGDTLRLSGPNGEVVLRRVAASSGPGRADAEMAGKWCYVSNVNALSGGARMSNQCFTFHPGGRYEYYGETDSYGANGGATSQSADRGTWTATGVSLTVRSSTGRVTVYDLEKRNHPKTNDPMLVLDGQTFVTYSPKAPWR